MKPVWIQETVAADGSRFVRAPAWSADIFVRNRARPGVGRRQKCPIPLETEQETNFEREGRAKRITSQNPVQKGKGC